MSELIKGDLTDEQYREYDFNGRVYRINTPVTLYFRKTGSTHRVVDSNGLVHCVPAPGIGNCVLRWQVKEGQPEVRF